MKAYTCTTENVGRPNSDLQIKVHIFFISTKTYVVGTQKNPKHIFKSMGKEIITILSLTGPMQY